MYFEVDKNQSKNERVGKCKKERREEKKRKTKEQGQQRYV